MVAPFFLARGLVRGAYIGTEAASAVVMHFTKLVVFGDRRRAHLAHRADRARTGSGGGRWCVGREEGS